MIRHIWTVICSKSVIDQDTNSISLLEVLEQLNISGPKLPKKKDKVVTIPLNFEVVTLWSRVSDDQPCRGNARIILFAPSGKKIKEFKHNVDLTTYKRFRNRVKIIGFPFPESGIYNFQIQIKEEKDSNWKEVANIPLQLELISSK